MAESTVYACLCVSMRGMYRSQVQIPSPRPLTPNSCLRAECITGRKGKPHGQIHSQLMSPRGMHRRSKLMCLNTSSSQLTSPRGMHLERQHHGQLQALLPTHVFARNASHGESGIYPVAALPTHVSARNASGDQQKRQGRAGSQLMSPHEMHRTALGVE